MSNEQLEPLSPVAVGMMELLERHFDERTLTAIEIADTLEVHPTWNRENRRRYIRDVAIELRNKGRRACGGNDGYWKARSDKEWHDYLEAVRRNARFRFVAARKMAQASSELVTGQGLLF